MDHIFAIFSLFERENAPKRWYTANEEVHCVKKGQTLALDLPPKSLVSVFPLGTGSWNAESTGLKWPLDGLTWKRGSFGLSNVAEDGPFRIHCIQGSFLVVIKEEPCRQS